MTGFYCISMRLLFTGLCLSLIVFAVDAKRKNVNCEKLQRKCNRGSSKACKKLAKLCSDFLRRQEDSSASSHVPAGFAGSLGAPAGILVEEHGTSIEVEWLPPVHYATLSGYELSYGEYIPDVVRVRLGADVTNYVIENVSPNVIYIIKVRPFDQLGNGPSIFQTIMTTVASEQPEIPNVDIPVQTVETTEDEATNHGNENLGQGSREDKIPKKETNIFPNFGTTAIPDGGRNSSEETS
ncbi:uncharacterized protein [Apostichopus japonicus]|uniref:uncharacterized protein isoform X2 n=1 Tax=Stichopus japonicus TaxID=307972 RepID=UPI003AB14624